jgi:hypothetical protein
MPLSRGDRVRLGGGYDMEPRWLQGNKGYLGPVLDFIPGQNEKSAAVVQLDHAITVDGVTGQIVVLKLRHGGARWDNRNTVHVELCDFYPEVQQWQDRRRGKWIESHASDEVILPRANDESAT